MNIATKRLKIEYTKLQKDPIPLGIAAPLETNILEWRFVIQGIEDYSEGYYQGKLVFPREYPQKPPSVLFITPNGRFETNKRICLSISDFHPETWSPGWTVGTILTGIISFFNCDEKTQGSVQSCSMEQKRKLAIESIAFNQKDPVFVQLFGKNPETLFIQPLKMDANQNPSSSSITESENISQEGKVDNSDNKEQNNQEALVDNVIKDISSLNILSLSKQTETQNNSNISSIAATTATNTTKPETAKKFFSLNVFSSSQPKPDSK